MNFIKCFVLTACIVVTINGGDIEQGNEAAEERGLSSRNAKIKEDAGMHAEDRIESRRVSSRGGRAWDGFKRSSSKRNYKIVVHSPPDFKTNRNVTCNVEISLIGDDGVTGWKRLTTLPSKSGVFLIDKSFIDVGYKINFITLRKVSGQNKWYPTLFEISSTSENGIVRSSCGYDTVGCQTQEDHCLYYLITSTLLTIPCL